MAHLGGKGPLGLKQPKAAKVKKPVRKVSAKRAGYLKSPERQAGLAHMAKVAAQPCIICGAFPVEVHHATKPRNDMQVLPLCPPHHRREFGVGAFHYSPKAFIAAHGSIESLLEKTNTLIYGK